MATTDGAVSPIKGTFLVTRNRVTVFPGVFGPIYLEHRAGSTCAAVTYPGGANVTPAMGPSM